MIIERSTKQADHISSYFLNINKKLSPKAGSPLMVLVSTLQGINEEGTYDEVISLSNRTNSTIGSHTEIENELKKGIGKEVSTIITIARNEVNPKIREVLQAIEEYKAQQLENKVGTLPIIKQLDLDALLTDEMFMDLISIYRESNIVVDESKINEIQQFLGGNINPDECTVLVTTGSKSLDNKILAYLGEEVRKVTDFSYLYNSGKLFEVSLKNLVIMFLTLNGIVNNRLEKVAALSNDTSMLAAMTAIKANIGRRLYNVINRLSSAVASGAVIVPPGIENYDVENELVVIGKTYKEWIEKKGGSHEAAIGFALLRRAGTGLVNLSEDKLINTPNDCALAYVEYLKHKDTLRMTNEINDIPRIIGEYLSRKIASSDLEAAGKIFLQERLQKAMQVPFYGNTNIVAYVRDIVCAVWTEGDTVKRVLIDIENTLKEFNNQDLDYAVFVAMCNLCGRWVSKQIEVV